LKACAGGFAFSRKSRRKWPTKDLKARESRFGREESKLLSAEVRGGCAEVAEED
jgi:hypothetical protein